MQPNLFVSIADDGTVTLTCSRSEMGQGVRTGIPMILADELEADWQRGQDLAGAGDETSSTRPARTSRTPTARAAPATTSRSCANWVRPAAMCWSTRRPRSGASIPARLLCEGPPPHHTGTGQWFDFGEVVDAAADIVVPTGDAAPKLKDESQWKYIGRDMPVVDNYDMSTGGATYGADISVPGMKIAVVARPPVYRGKVKSFDASAALKVQGVEQVIEIPALADDKPAEFRALGGVAVIGTNTWS